MTLELLALLGLELRRRGLRRHLDRARELYASIRDGGHAEWTLEHASRLASILGLGPEPLRVATRCPQCPPPQLGTWNGSRTSIIVDDVVVMRCSSCATEWRCS